MRFYFKENFRLLYADGQLYDQYDREVYNYRNETLMFPEISLWRDGSRIGTVKKRFSWFMRHYDLYYQGRYIDTIRQQFTFFASELLLENLGWKIKGDFFSLNYQVYNEDDELIAEVSQEIFRLTRRYYIEIYDNINEELIVLVILAINQFDKDRQAAANAAASSNH